MQFPVEETIKARSSIRTYQSRPLSADDRQKITEAIEAVRENPFSNATRIRIIDTVDGEETRRLGTYGMIKGAQTFLGIAVEKGESAMESVGFVFEQLVLYATHLGLGTCWMGGTFNREDFTEPMHVGENEFFPIISPIGYPAEKRRMIEKIVRKAGKADKRKPWEALFFDENFDTPLSKEKIGAYAFPLEMLRLAPSAVNKQPWRILVKDGAFHFLEAKDAKDDAPYDIHKIDVGIAACHFQLAAEEKSLSGKFEKLSSFDAPLPDRTEYLFTWIPD